MLKLNIREPWFSYIKNGEKTIESRVGPHSKFSCYIGKLVEFSCNGEKNVKNVVDVKWFPTISEYLSETNWHKITPQAETVAESNKFHEEIYSPETVQVRGGICGLYLN